MSYFDDIPKNFEGDRYDLIITEDCSTKMKKSGTFFRATARLKKICESGHFGAEKKRHKYEKKTNVGWLKWEDGLRVYYSIYEGTILLTTEQSGKNKKEQGKAIKRAEQINKEVIYEIENWEEKNKK